MSHEKELWVIIAFFIAGLLSLTNLMGQQRSQLRRLDRKLDILLKAQGIDWPMLSPQVQLLAQSPANKIAAIKLYREENPDLDLAEAKAEIEAFAAKK